MARSVYPKSSTAPPAQTLLPPSLSALCTSLLFLPGHAPTPSISLSPPPPIPVLFLSAHLSCTNAGGTHCSHPAWVAQGMCAVGPQGTLPAVASWPSGCVLCGRLGRGPLKAFPGRCGVGSRVGETEVSGSVLLGTSQPLSRMDPSSTILLLSQV